MSDGPRTAVTIYVDRSKQQWVVRDREGNLWLLPAMTNPWENRRPYEPTDQEKAELEPIPGHYKSTLGLPF
jgi:hypothetical protein